MSRQMLNEKTFQNVPHLEPITIPGRPDVAPKVMTLEGTIWRSAFLLVLAIASAVYGWSFGDQVTGTIATIMLIGLLGLVVLSIVTAFKPQIAPFTGPLYAVVMGFWAGVISFGYEQEFDGIVLQAVFATFAVFAGALFLYGSRIVKVTKKFIAVVMMATLGILLMYVAAIVLGLFGIELGFINDPSPLGIGLSVGDLRRRGAEPLRRLLLHRGRREGRGTHLHVVVLRVRPDRHPDLALPRDPAAAGEGAKLSVAASPRSRCWCRRGRGLGLARPRRRAGATSRASPGSTPRRAIS